MKTWVTSGLCTEARLSCLNLWTRIEWKLRASKPPQLKKRKRSLVTRQEYLRVENVWMCKDL